MIHHDYDGNNNTTFLLFDFVIAPYKSMSNTGVDWWMKQFRLD